MNKNYMIGGIILVLVVLLAYFFAFQSIDTVKTSIVKTETKTITVAGSGSAMFALKNWSELYTKEHPDIVFNYVQTSDSGLGLSALKEKRVSAAATSRIAKDTEKFPEITELKFAKDAIVFAANESVKGVFDLTCDQLKSIYTKKIKNWNDLGGGEKDIIFFDREESESAKKLFRELCLKDEKISPLIIQVLSDKEMLEAIQNNVGGVGFLSYGRAKSGNLTVFTVDGFGVNDVDSGNYKYVRDFYFYTRTDSAPEVKDFALFVNQKKDSILETVPYFIPDSADSKAR